MAPDRVLSAFQVWVRNQLAGSEKGQQTWEQYVAAVNAPPPARMTAPAPAALSAPAGAPAEAALTPQQEAAAFQRFLGMT